MNKTVVLIFALCCIILSSLPVQSGPRESLSDIIAASSVIFTGKFQDSRKTDKSITRNFFQLYFHITTLKVDTLLKGAPKIKHLDVVDLPGTDAGVDTSRTASYLYFISNSTFILDSTVDLMVERKYKITNGKITPTEVIDEEYEQPVSQFLVKVRKIIREQKKKK